MHRLLWLVEHHPADIPAYLDQARPATTPHTVDAEPSSPADARDLSAARVEAGTPLVAAGLSSRALSAAQDQLKAPTVGELVKIPAARVQRLRDLDPEWREKLRAA